MANKMMSEEASQQDVLENSMLQSTFSSGGLQEFDRSENSSDI